MSFVRLMYGHMGRQFSVIDRPVKTKKGQKSSVCLKGTVHTNLGNDRISIGSTTHVPFERGSRKREIESVSRPRLQAVSPQVT